MTDVFPSCDSGTEAASDNCTTASVGELEREGPVLKARVATAGALVVRLMECSVGMSTRVENLNRALVTSGTELKRLNCELTTVRDAFTAVTSEAVRNANIRELQQMVTDLSMRVEDANGNSEMSVLVHEQLAHRIRFVFAGAVRMVTLSTSVVFEEFADRLKVGIPLIMTGNNFMGTVIDEESYR